METVQRGHEAEIIVLPPPALPAVTLDRALERRHSGRSFRPDPLSAQTLSNLLWAGFGINRRETGQRTAPSAHNWQETDLYAFMAEGTYRYEAQTHRLLLVSASDLRGLTGMQDFVASAPLNLVYVARFASMQEVGDEDRPFLAGADAGFIAQNVYLCCAAMELATVVRGLVDRRSLAQALGLPATHRVTLAQSVGQPGREA